MESIASILNDERCYIRWEPCHDRHSKLINISFTSVRAEYTLHEQRYSWALWAQVTATELKVLLVYVEMVESRFHLGTSECCAEKAIPYTSVRQGAQTEMLLKRNSDICKVRKQDLRQVRRPSSLIGKAGNPGWNINRFVSARIESFCKTLD